jgi:hypothetical protein
MPRHLKVFVENDPDGSTHVYCDELPGLILAGRNRAKILGAILPAAKAILERQGEPTDDIVIDADFVAPRQFYP